MAKKLTEKEEKILKELAKKKKDFEKQEKIFWKEVSARKEEIFDKIFKKDFVKNCNQKNQNNAEKILLKLAEKYETDVNTLISHFSSEKQINYFKNFK